MTASDIVFNFYDRSLTEEQTHAINERIRKQTKYGWVCPCCNSKNSSTTNLCICGLLNKDYGKV